MAAGGILKGTKININEDSVVTERPTLGYGTGTSILRGGIIDVSEIWNIRLKNLERWRTQPAFHTIDFEIVDTQLYKSYKLMEERMAKYYGDPKNSETQHLSLEFVMNRKIELAALKVDTGVVHRVHIFHIPQDKYFRNLNPADIQEFWIDDEDNRVDNDYRVRNLPLKLLLGDDSKNMEFDPSTMKLFYLVEQFASLPFKTRELFLQNTEQFENLDEFRDESRKVINMEDTYICHVDAVNRSGIPFVTLRRPDLPKTINNLLCVAAAAALPKPCAPPVGKVFSGGILVHMEMNGEVFIQFRNSYTYDIFEFFTRKYLTNDKYNEAKAKGPYPIDHDTIYIAPYYEELYRCKVYKLLKDSRVYVYYIDYGNFDTLKSEELVSCEAVSDVLNALPPQVLRAHLRNVGRCEVEEIFAKVKGSNLYAVETVEEASDSKVPVVDLLLHHKQTSYFSFSEDMIKARLASHWSSKPLPAKALEKINKMRI